MVSSLVEVSQVLCNMHRCKPTSAAQHSSGNVGLQHSTGNVASSLPASVSHRSAPQSQPPAPVLHQRSPALQPTSVPHSHRNVDLQHPAPARHSAENLGLLQQPRTVQQLTFGNIASFPQCAPVHYRSAPPQSTSGPRQQPAYRNVATYNNQPNTFQLTGTHLNASQPTVPHSHGRLVFFF